MSRPTVPTCDECGTQKKETNHWWIAWACPLSWRVWPFEKCPIPSEDAHFSPLDPIVLDLCSEQCVTRAIGKWMRGELK